MNKLSSRFLELWGNEKRSLDIVEYELCLNEWQSAHDKKMIGKYVITILFFWEKLKGTDLFFRTTDPDLRQKKMTGYFVWGTVHPERLN